MPYSAAQMIHKYNAMWADARQLLDQGAVVSSARQKEGHDEVALSLIAPATQFDSQVLKTIEQVQENLVAVDPAHYFYPISTLHITLLGCTPFFASLLALDPKKTLVGDIARTVLDQWRRPVRLNINGINVSQYSVFLQINARDQDFFCLRNRLLAAFKEAHQQPTELWDDHEIHMNIMKFGHCDRYRLRLLIPAIENLRDVAIGSVLLTQIQLVEADRLNAVSNVIRTFTCNHPM